jgi:hypothetical protein
MQSSLKPTLETAHPPSKMVRASFSTRRTSTKKTTGKICLIIITLRRDPVMTRQSFSSREKLKDKLLNLWNEDMEKKSVMKFPSIGLSKSTVATGPICSVVSRNHKNWVHSTKRDPIG